MNRLLDRGRRLIPDDLGLEFLPCQGNDVGIRTMFGEAIGGRSFASGDRDLLDRPALYESLDGSGEPALWIGAPAGYGKTSLARGYVAARGYNCVWHQMDLADMDQAGFFVYLGQAFQRGFPECEPLPRPGPESLLNLPSFARSFFDQLFDRLPSPFAVVLDDLHQIPEDSPLIRLLALAVDRLPEEGRFLFISRRAPAPPFARLLANSALRLMDPDSLKLSLEEAHGLARLMRVEDPNAVNRACELVEGWAAGLILLLRHGVSLKVAPTYGSREAIFDYFLNEVLAQSDAELEKFLTRSAFLPRMTPAVAAKMTGTKRAEELLVHLHKEALFTNRSGDDKPSYSYHHLFREFLLRRAEHTLPTEALNLQRMRAAELMEEEGELDEAARSWLASGKPEEVARMICQHSQRLFGLGQSETIRSWLGLLPEEVVEHDPWLSFWAGNVEVFSSPEVCRNHLRRAHEMFEDRGDWAGALLSCTAALESFLTSFGDFAEAKPWIELLENLLAQAPEPIPPALEVRIISSLKIVNYLDPAHPILPPWIERAWTLAASLPDPIDRITVATGIAQRILWEDPTPFRGVIEDASRSVDTSNLPAGLEVFWRLFESNYATFRAEFDRARQVSEKAISICRRQGMDNLEGFAHRCMIYLALAMGDTKLADSSVKLAKSKLGMHSGTDAMHQWYLESQVALLSGDVSEAYSCIRTSNALEETTSMPYGIACGRISTAGISVEAGRFGQAERLLEEAGAMARKLGMSMLDSHTDLVRAHLAIRKGAIDDASEPLRRALSAMNRRGYLVWDLTMRPQLAALLAGAALELDIERDFVLQVIRGRKLRPSATAGESWPWPVRVETLGAFRVLVDDEPLRVTGKEQKKPLELLKLLIAHGGRQVPMALLSDELWPDAEGDAAVKSFKTTLHRLRRLLQHKDAILLGGGRLSINPDICFVDALAFNGEADRLERKLLNDAPDNRDAALQAAERLIRRYRGQFVRDDSSLPSLTKMREHLRRRFHRLALLAGSSYEASGSLQLAASLYDRCLRIDPDAKTLWDRVHGHKAPAQNPILDSRGAGDEE